MSDFRAFGTPSAANPSELTLSRDESHHLVAVNRAAVGDTVVVFDGRGNEWICGLATASKTGATLRVKNHKAAAPLPYAITLAQAIPKGPAMDAIVRKATEIGAARIVPLESERTQVHLEAGRQDRKIEKWQVAALEAAKQCGNPWLPEIAPVQTVTDFMKGSGSYDLKLVASLQPEAQSLKNALCTYRERTGKYPVQVVWLVGPEGDFSSSELAAASAAGFQAITLGPLVLRCETASVYALSVLSYELQNPQAAR